MNPKAVIDQLSKLRNWNRMTAVKREAIDKAIKAVEAHELAKECFIKEKETLVFGDGEQGTTGETTTISMHCCPNCGSSIRMKSSVLGIHKGNPFPNYCPVCGQKLKAPGE